MTIEMIYFPHTSIRIFIAFGAVAFLVSCSAVQEDNLDLVRLKGSVPQINTISPARATLSTLGVRTDRTPAQYVKDLEQCRSFASRVMGPSGTGDDIPALKRALKNEITGSTLEVGYVSADPAIKRDLLVRKCVSRKGYILSE